ncbi:DUF4238 domain-containing protein [Sphingomonas sp. CGMCC 1.13654]|uniref:DUF4238 domain-containing protein n=1 Tax=Sphingomonas chungangi TaxID=2683589 RepID=A0A838L2C3_9SPHN|nr:DUF4238 domain-containing protein [Sphingomonas chungangi]MBA2933070.1 DUF4238 domain-containing protein [Sphingomonas chungangi]MVW56690.1 DUF4238 domain-containing protein [Sphingomonas chungangi]
MNAPKLHHYVPQFHLRRFADSKGCLWVWDKQNDRIFSAPPAGMAAETHFYRLTQYEGLGYDPAMMEHQLSSLEAAMAAVTGQWLDWLPDMAPLDRLPIPRANRRAVALFLAVQVLRTRDTRDILSALVELDRGTRPSQQEERELHTELIWDEKLVETLARRFSRSIWIIGLNDSGTPFVTSDNPVAFRTADNRQWRRAAILERGTYLVYPLSPTAILYCHPPHGHFRALRRFADSVSPVTFTQSMVESDNSGQTFMATRFLMSSRQNFEAERAFAATVGTDIYAG